LASTLTEPLADTTTICISCNVTNNRRPKCSDYAYC